MDRNAQEDVFEGGDNAASAPRAMNAHTNDNEASGGESCHILMIPGASQAHQVTCFRLSKELVSRGGVVITFVTQRNQIARVESVYSRGELQKLGITFESLDDDSTFGSLKLASEGIQKAIQPLKEKWLAEKRAGVFKPNCVVADRFFTWAQELSEELQLPRYIYNSNAAVFLRYAQASVELMPSTLREALKQPDWLTRTCTALSKEKGLEFIRHGDVPGLFRPGSYFPEWLVKVWENCESADGIIINTVSELEAAVIDSIKEALRIQNPHGKVPRFYTIGPITNPADFRNETFTAHADGGSTECLDWQNTQPDNSVLYVCLGSQTHLSRPQILQLALALEASQQRFLWCLLCGEDDSTTLEEVLPPGFLERVAGRGKVCGGWVAQVAVLSHKSTFGFLSHCGWQSIFESFTCGVPILGWPRQNEQFLNCRYITEILKVGMRVNERPGDELTGKEEFEKAILKFMVEDERVLLDAAQQKKLLLAAAVAKGGSSYLNREELIKAMRKA